MTAMSEIRQRARAQAHDITAPSASLPGGEVYERVVGRRVLELAVEVDAAAGTTIAERSEFGFPASQWPNGVEVKEIKFRSLAVTPHADNHFTDTFTARDVNGVTNTTVATLTSDADVAVGSGGLGGSATTAHKEYAALLDTTVANRQISAGGVLTLTRAKGGTGVQLGRVHYTIVVEAL